jgi:hypothetical protein
MSACQWCGDARFACEQANGGCGWFNLAGEMWVKGREILVTRALEAKTMTPGSAAVYLTKYGRDAWFTSTPTHRCPTPYRVITTTALREAMTQEKALAHALIYDDPGDFGGIWYPATHSLLYRESPKECKDPHCTHLEHFRIPKEPPHVKAVETQG